MTIPWFVLAATLLQPISGWLKIRKRAFGEERGIGIVLQTLLCNGSFVFVATMNLIRTVKFEHTCFLCHGKQNFACCRRHPHCGEEYSKANGCIIPRARADDIRADLVEKCGRLNFSMTSCVTPNRNYHGCICEQYWGSWVFVVYWTMRSPENSKH